MPAPALGSALALARRCMPQEAAPLPSRADDGGHRSRWEEKKALMDARGAARRHEVQSKVEDANFGTWIESEANLGKLIASIEK